MKFDRIIMSFAGREGVLPSLLAYSSGLRKEMHHICQNAECISDNRKDLQSIA